MQGHYMEEYRTLIIFKFIDAMTILGYVLFAMCVIMWTIVFILIIRRKISNYNIRRKSRCNKNGKIGSKKL